MKKQLFILLISILSFNSFAQIEFEKGYFINSNDEKTACFIKNINWNTNPTEFEYKITETSESKTATIENTKEFFVANFKYKRFTVNIDKSSISYEKDPEYSSETFLLKVLIEGEASLYIYQSITTEFYFFNINDSEVTQLIHKKYKLENETTIGENNMYKQQIGDSLICKKASSFDSEILDYDEKDLVHHFIKYNKCVNSDYTIYGENKFYDLINLKIKAGVNVSSLSIPALNVAPLDEQAVDFGTSIGYRLGFEAEFIMPFNKNKWSIIVDPTYNYFTAESTTLSTTVQNAKVSYSVLEVPIGIRNSLFLNDTSKIFISGYFVLGFDLGSTIEFENSADIEFARSNHWAFGIGYSIQNKYSIELKYDTNNDGLLKESYYQSDYNNISITFGYTIFQN